ncbi:hypothetical protein RZ532_01000 [Nitratireductor aquimarinus]|uniref:hypothetical protein n=1 Tax=Nitratireductor aquimarinus TaxID=889300 RepID=UPI0029360E59|nr:hypothetical protein [Nitratireductor aquimarinus]MDV2964538.1 hypothetical protein [Nitratireductor aquimarinus]
MTFPMPFIVPANRPILPVTIEYAGNKASGDSGTSLTFTSVPLGAVDAKKDAFLSVHWRTNGPGGAANLTGVTLGGVSAAILQQETQDYNSGYPGCGTALVRLPASGVTAGTIVLSFDQSGTNSGVVSVYRVANAADTPVQMKKTRRGGSLGELSVTMAVPEEGAVLAQATVANNSGMTFASPVGRDYFRDSGITSLAGRHTVTVEDPSLLVKTSSGNVIFNGVLGAYVFR